MSEAVVGAEATVRGGTVKGSRVRPGAAVLSLVLVVLVMVVSFETGAQGGSYCPLYLMPRANGQPYARLPAPDCRYVDDAGVPLPGQVRASER